jgi:hypothetical protein
MPFEKDSRRGTLRGTKEGTRIKATWTFRQEGQSDSLPVHFELANKRLLQKPYRYHRESGREYVADTSRYTLSFQQIDCAGFPAAGSL